MIDLSKRIPLLKVLVWLGALTPLGLLVYELFFGSRIVDDPVELIQHQTGIWALRLLFVSLSITPLRRLTGLNWLVKFRRVTGLFGFFYAVLHAFSYFVFDHSLDLAEIWSDVIEHPWVWVGFIAFIFLIPLAVTSTTGWIRRMGGQNWNRLHKLVYLISALGVLHFYWLVKADATEPFIYAGVLGAIFAARYFIKPRKTAVSPGRPTRPTGPGPTRPTGPTP
jgi:methionine sulfoxide reductase heme-binding subunit